MASIILAACLSILSSVTTVAAAVLTGTVTDEQDLTDTVGIQVRVDETAIPPAPDQPPVAVITAPAQGLLDEPIIFDAANSQSANPIVSFAWQFGDGSQAYDFIEVSGVARASIDCGC